MLSRILFLFFCPLFFLLFADASNNNLKGSRPNIIFFLADDQTRVDHSIYGNEKVPTPVTESFSKEAMIFDEAFTGQGICAPSRSMLYTGLYPIRNGCFVNHTGIRKEVKTLPYYLKELGYEVILAGKEHIKPREQFPWTAWYKPIKNKDKPRPSVPIEEIDTYLSSVKKPFCLIVASEYPHGPYHKKTNFSAEDIKIHPYENDRVSHRNYLARYYQNIVEKENEFNKILSLIDKHSIKDDTIVFYADDHGRGRGKFTVYDTALNVAFLVRWPQKIQATRTSKLISFTDFVPTAIELAGGDLKDKKYNFDGKSLIPVFEGRNVGHHEFVYGVAHNQGIQNRHIFPQRSIHNGRFHYIFNFNSKDHLDKLSIGNSNHYYFYLRGAEKHPDQSEEELYDTWNDPNELNNLAYDENYNSTKEYLKKNLFSWMISQKDFLKENGPVPFFKVWGNGALDLDYNSPKFNYEIPDHLVGVLENEKVDPHSLP